MNHVDLQDPIPPRKMLREQLESTGRVIDHRGRYPAVEDLVSWMTELRAARSRTGESVPVIDLHVSDTVRQRLAVMIAYHNRKHLLPCCTQMGLTDPLPHDRHYIYGANCELAVIPSRFREIPVPEDELWFLDFSDMMWAPGMQYVTSEHPERQLLVVNCKVPDL